MSKTTFALAALCCGLSLQPWMARGAAQSTSGARDARTFIVLGCLRAEPSDAGSAGRGQSGERRFLMTDSRAKSDTYRLDGDAEQLTYHVGHLIEVAGQISGPITPASSPNRTESTPLATLKVKSVIYISPTCGK